MTPSATALLGFAAWTIALVLTLVVFRTGLVFAGKKTAIGFNPSGEDLEGFGRRLTRAHANCYENLPAAAAVLLYAIATNQTAVTDPLAYAFIAARIAQSLTHLISATRPFVPIRFAFYIVQNIILIVWLLALFGVAG
jgi:uncharacterized MAPEG superfamily protein